MRRIYYFLANERLQVGELVIVKYDGLKKVTASDIYQAIFYVLKERNMMVYEKGDVVPITPLINGEIYKI